MATVSPRVNRINDPEELDEAAIGEHIAAGTTVVVQFSKPVYTPEILRSLDRLCARFKDKLQVRFYGHYQSTFDCRVVQQVPSANSLAVDCLSSASHVEAIYDLENLQELALGIWDLSVPSILANPSLRNLKSLVVGETRRPLIDLGPIAQMSGLRYLHVTSQFKNIDAIGSLPALEALSLSRIKKPQKLDFVNRIGSLRSLRLILGGRSDIAEVAHKHLRLLEIIRILGLEYLDPSSFPGLAVLHIEDQIRLKHLAFTNSSDSIELLRILNCKGLKSLAGLSLLANLIEMRISGTAIDLESLIALGLPPHLRIFAFYVGKVSANQNTRERLDKMGYREGTNRLPGNPEV